MDGASRMNRAAVVVSVCVVLSQRIAVNLCPFSTQWHQVVQLLFVNGAEEPADKPTRSYTVPMYPR